MTNNLARRLKEHSSKVNEGFTNKYNTSKLVYYESYAYILEAIAREKQLKNWHADWKWNLVKQSNPELVSLDEEVLSL